MTTWTSKGVIAALALTTLAACEGGQGGLLTKSQDAEPVVALSQSKMAFGAVTLVAPSGFCIDKGSLKQNFAMMAPCERLGAPSAAAGAPVSILTASFSTASGSVPTPLDIAAAYKLDAVSGAVETDAGVTFRATGTAPTKDLGNTHWRGTAVVGTQVMGLALYGPANGRATGTEGRAILSGLIKAINSSN